MEGYFRPGSRVIGLDIDLACRQHADEGISVLTGSHLDPSTLETVFSAYPRIEVVIDDDSHVVSHMIGTFELMDSRLHRNGVVIVEDTHTCHWPEHGGGLRREGSFIEFAKHKLEGINAFHAKGALPVTPFTRSTDCIACHDSVVEFERRPKGQRFAPMTRAM